MPYRFLGLRPLLALTGLTAAGCPVTVDENPPPPMTGGVDTGDPEDTTGTTGTEPPADTTDGSASTTSADETETETGACEPVTVPFASSTDPVGVVFLVDNGPGMAEEALEVSVRLNQFYSELSAQLDTSVVMISAYAGVDPQGVCINPPLGNGSCPNSDNNPPEYIHIDLPVTPLNAISHIFVTYDQWANALPPNTRRHLVAISDGDTGVAVGDFDESFLMLDPEDNANYRFHASVALSGCKDSVTDGNNFAALTEFTNGYLHDLCSQNYETFFQALVGSIVNDTGDRCRWELPPIPPGVEFDPDLVELLLDVDGIMTSPQHVASELECPVASTGWYWENPAAPTVLLACPGTCELLEEFAVVQSFVRFGCPADG